jgi:hypothetical protein
MKRARSPPSLADYLPLSTQPRTSLSALALEKKAESLTKRSCAPGRPLTPSIHQLERFSDFDVYNALRTPVR